jgi:hemerythrin-like domain-containing protein
VIATAPLSMPDPIVTWHAEHVYFRRLLDVLRRQVDLFQSGDRPNYELMLDIISYLRDYSDKFHHPREDVAFARLALHCPEMKLPLARLAQQHRVIANAGDKLAALLDEVLEDVVVERSEIETAAATYLVYYNSHIAEEEREILVRAAATLTPEDWAAVAAAVPGGEDPLFGKNTSERYKHLRHQIAIRS